VVETQPFIKPIWQAFEDMTSLLNPAHAQVCLLMFLSTVSPLKYFVSPAARATPAACTTEPVYTGTSGKEHAPMVSFKAGSAVRAAWTVTLVMTPAAASSAATVRVTVHVMGPVAPDTLASK
jgi:hypothetical protein